MNKRTILIADDLDAKRGHIEDVVTGATGPNVEVIRTKTTRETIDTIAYRGDDFDEGYFDYDFIGEKDCGADLIAALYKKNPQAKSTLVTAREGAAFEEARDRALAAGAVEAISAKSDQFEQELTSVVTTGYATAL